MKIFKTNLILGTLVFVSILGYVLSCTHKDVAVPAAASNELVIVRGTAVLKPGTMTKGDTTQWKLDKVHSNVMWSTNYMGAAGLLTGRFNQFGMHDVVTAEMINYVTTGQPVLDSSWAFDEAHPENSYFNGYVQMDQSNTGEPGRDGGCYLASVGAPAIVAGTQNLTNANIAKIKTTKVSFDPTSADYIVNLNLTWQGPSSAPVTKALVGKLHFVPVAKITPATGTPYNVMGLQLKFQFNCRDYGVTSTSIADNINIECNMNFNNK
ncbi:MAG: YceI family protein [Bacteroidota bacterium]|nr:YceI family protein [Bacteroidota bacterium]